ncbi:hypothetical protein PEXP_035350 [Penicillium expansum]|nr:hypothetical protein PEXP_035350 [Penicillium expansum]
METTPGVVALRQLPSSDGLHDEEAPEYTRHDSSSDSSPLHDEELPSYSQAQSAEQIPSREHSIFSRRLPWVSLLSIIYIGLVIYTWAMTVMLSAHPLKAKSWVYTIDSLHLHYYGENGADFHRERKIYRSVRTIQTFIQVVTLPWISTVCASAAVSFAQNRKKSMGLRPSQATTLADREWMDFSFYRAVVYGRWRQYGLKLLAAAIFIWVFGLITYPIQSLFLSSQSVKVRTYPEQRADVYDFRSVDRSDSSSYKVGKDVLQVRDALGKANTYTYQPNLWSNNSEVQFLTLSDMSSQTFYSQVPSGFNTGLLRQFAPRVNSTATYEIIDASQFPVDCGSSSEAFYAEYSASFAWYTAYSWNIIACMPGNMTESPWRTERNRQDFSEVLYLNMTQDEYASRDSRATLYRITVNTTAGFFELPNYMNQGVPGPLLAQDPVALCDQHCLMQIHSYYPSNYRRRDESTASSTLKAASLGPISAQSKGPLLSTALATFGPGSFIDTFMQFGAAIKENKAADGLLSSVISTCIANPTLTNLLGSSSLECMSIEASPNGTWYPAGTQIAQWINRLQQSAESIPQVFTAAAFLANKEFLSAQGGGWSINQDLGADMDLPSISRVGIIAVSVLMGLYLLPLVFLLLVGCKTDKLPGPYEMHGVVRVPFGKQDVIEP